MKNFFPNIILPKDKKEKSKFIDTYDNFINSYCKKGLDNLNSNSDIFFIIVTFLIGTFTFKYNGISIYIKAIYGIPAIIVSVISLLYYLKLKKNKTKSPKEIVFYNILSLLQVVCFLFSLMYYFSCIFFTRWANKEHTIIILTTLSISLIVFILIKKKGNKLITARFLRTESEIKAMKQTKKKIRSIILIIFLMISSILILYDNKLFNFFLYRALICFNILFIPYILYITFMNYYIISKYDDIKK